MTLTGTNLIPSLSLLLLATYTNIKCETNITFTYYGAQCMAIFISQCVVSPDERRLTCHRQRQPQKFPIGLFHCLECVVGYFQAGWCVSTTRYTCYINTTVDHFFGILEYWLVFCVPMRDGPPHVAVHTRHRQNDNTKMLIV